MCSLSCSFKHPKAIHGGLRVPGSLGLPAEKQQLAALFLCCGFPPTFCRKVPNGTVATARALRPLFRCQQTTNTHHVSLKEGLTTRLPPQLSTAVAYSVARAAP